MLIIYIIIIKLKGVRKQNSSFFNVYVRPTYYYYYYIKKYIYISI